MKVVERGNGRGGGWRGCRRVWAEKFELLREEEEVEGWLEASKREEGRTGEVEKRIQLVLSIPVIL